ncbi:MAG: DUF1501 domain-containing protein, partial [Rubripirellula sp.]|nr:DUF1501 domain-containing protein [Rubripirellula sp.]
MNIRGDDRFDRRVWLQQAGAGMGMLGALHAFAESPEGFSVSQEKSLASRTHFPPRAKRVIHLFMNGGPFQGDLFDPKQALEKYAGQRPASADLLTERPTG